MSAPFRSWAERVYDHETVRDALLELQDKAGLNVNILLWGCWTAKAHGPVSDLAMRHAISAVDDWDRMVVRPLRTARRALKNFAAQQSYDAAGDLRARAKSLELDAEFAAIAVLEALSAKMLEPSSGHDPRAHARRNLTAYVALTGAARAEGFSTSLLHRLIDNIFHADDPANHAPS